MTADEITVEGNRVIVRASLRGKHTGYVEGMPPTFIRILRRNRIRNAILNGISEGIRAAGIDIGRIISVGVLEVILP